MNRKEKREIRKDKDLVKELYAIIIKYLPNLLNMFGELKDVRNQSYITYKMKTICVTRLFGLLCGITTMTNITDEFDSEIAIKNLSVIAKQELKELPHHDTISDVFEHLSIDELRNIQKYIVKTLIRSKMFDRFRYKNAFQLVFDGTGYSNHNYDLNDNCLFRKHKDGTVSYYKYVLECKLVIGNIVISLDSEFIENSDISNETAKQDCEINAFKRMVERIKSNYPKQKFIITGDALYATTPVINICKEYKWFYIFNLKKDRLKIVYEDFIDNVNYHNETVLSNYFLLTNYIWNDNTFNVLKFIDTKNNVNIEFNYITNIKTNNDNIKSIVTLARQRWRIENEGFNIQKNGTFNISHLSSRNDIAMKAHYFFIQFAHTIRQLLDNGSILVRELKLKLKEISKFLTKLLTSTTSDLSNSETNFQLRFDDFII